MVALASYVKLFDKTMSNVVEVKSRGADVLGLTVDARAADMAKTVDHVIPVPDTHPPASPLTGRGAHAALCLLRGPPAGLRHRQAPQPGQVGDRGMRGDGMKRLTALLLAAALALSLAAAGRRAKRRIPSATAYPMPGTL